MKLTLCLTFVFATVTAAAAGSQWLAYDEAVRTARVNNRSVIVFYGRDGCPYSGPARRAFDDEQVSELMNGRFVQAYVDLGTPAGKADAKRGHVASTPVLRFLGPDAKERWRRTSPEKSSELVAALQEVIDGKSFQQQEALLHAGSLGPRETLDLATAYLDRGWDRKGESLLREMKKDPSQFDETMQREASFTRIEYATPEERLKLLPKHLKVYPDDRLALINYAYALRNDSLDKRRAAVRRVASSIGEEKDPRIAAEGYRLIVQFVVYWEPAAAAWGVPYGEQRLVLDRTDMDALSDFVSLAILADQRDKIAEARGLALAAGREEARITTAIAEGEKQAEKSRSKMNVAGAASVRL